MSSTLFDCMSQVHAETRAEFALPDEVQDRLLKIASDQRRALNRRGEHPSNEIKGAMKAVQSYLDATREDLASVETAKQAGLSSSPEQPTAPATQSSAASVPATQGDTSLSPSGEVSTAEVEGKGFTKTELPPRTEAGSIKLPAELKGALDHGIELVRQGVTDFAQWSAAMLKKFGEAIKEYLADVWAAATKTSEVGAVQMGGTVERNAPDSQSKAKPLKEEFGGAPQDYTAFQRDAYKAKATEIVDSVGSIDEMARILGSEDGVRSIGLHPALQEFVQAETLKRARVAVETAANDVDRIRAQQTLRKVKALWDVTGTEAGQHMAARRYSAEEMRAEEPAMAVDTAIEQQQEATINRALPVEPVREVVEKAVKEAGPAATEKVAETMDELEAKRGQLADEKAGKLIYEVSKLHRQSGYILTNGPNADNIRKVFRDHVREPLSPEEFHGRLSKLGVTDPIIERLDIVAKRERAALDQAAQQKAKARLLDKDSSALAKLLTTLRAKIAPSLNWRDIFTSEKATQREWEIETYKRIRMHEALRGLSHSEAVELTREISKAWQRERRKVFNRELTKQLSKVAGIKPAAAKKVEASSPRLLQLINLGAFDSASFRDAVAKEWGIANLSSPAAKRLKEIGIAMQAAPEGVPKRKLAQQFIEGLQDLTKLTKAQILDSYWTAAVLSGWRTHVDIGLGVLNGIEDVGLGSIVTAFRTGNYDVARRGIGRMLANLPTALEEFVVHMRTGDKSFMRKFDADAKAALEDGNRFIGAAGRQLLNKGGFYKFPGAFMEYLGRLLTGLDHINSTSTFEGAKMMAMARHPELYAEALRIGPREKANARAQARNELTAGVEPKNLQEKVQENARVKEILEQGVPTEIIAEASEIGADAALQGDPTGMGWLIWQIAQSPKVIMERAVQSAEKKTQATGNGKGVLRALRVASTFASTISGTKFGRSVGHFMNRQVSYLPGLGLVRFTESGMRGVKSDILIAKQLVGTVAALGFTAWARSHKDDDEGGIEGGWKGLTAAQRSQLYAQGKQPNTVWVRDSKGRVVSVNFLQWGLAGIIGTVGAMEDQRKYHGNDSDSSIIMNGLTLGLLSVSDRTQMQGLAQLFGDSAYSTSGKPADTMVQKLQRYAATTGGGFVPRILKDIDAVMSPELRTAHDGWALWAQQIPMIRELTLGKRVNIFGEDIKLDRSPTSRVVQWGTFDPAYRLMGRMNERDLWLTDPSSGQRKVKVSGGEPREMTPQEKDSYQKRAGAAYKAFVLENGEQILSMPQDRAKKFIRDHTKIIRDRAAIQAVGR